MDLELTGKVCLVAAASRGLGRAAASALSEEGARLAIFSHSGEIHHTAEAIRGETGGEVLSWEADLRNREDIETVVEQAMDHYGRIDILITNAGGPPPGGFLDLKPQDWESAFQLTLMSAVHLCYKVVPLMLESGGGSIVAIQSYSVKQPIPNLLLSNSIRLAVIGLVKSLAEELGPQGIRVNSINPAWTWTERVEQLMQDRADRQGTSVPVEVDRISKEIPLQRMGTVEEFGRTIAWLASPAAAFIHGHALMFDGGAVKATL